MRAYLVRLICVVASVFLFALPLHAAVGHAAEAQQEIKDTYTLGVGDRIDVRVYGEDDLNVEVTLSESGVFNYPFLGEIRALGLTALELEKRITAGLQGDYLVNPDVLVRIVSYGSIFLNGEVRNPGGISYQPGLTLRKALALAGGLTERASKGDITVIRGDDATKKLRAIALDDSVYPGDIITVKQSFF